MNTETKDFIIEQNKNLLVEMGKQIGALEERLTMKIESVRVELTVQIEESKNELKNDIEKLAIITGRQFNNHEQRITALEKTLAD